MLVVYKRYSFYTLCISLDKNMPRHTKSITLDVNIQSNLIKIPPTQMNRG